MTANNYGTHQAELFAGAAYVPELDRERLGKQMGRVYDCMKSGLWKTLAEISRATGDPEGSVGSQLRNLRMERFGAHEIPRRRRGDPAAGLFEYRLAKQTVEAFQAPRLPGPQVPRDAAEKFAAEVDDAIAVLEELALRAAVMRSEHQAPLFRARRELSNLSDLLHPTQPTANGLSSKP